MRTLPTLVLMLTMLTMAVHQAFAAPIIEVTNVSDPLLTVNFDTGDPTFDINTVQFSALNNLAVSATPDDFLEFGDNIFFPDFVALQSVEFVLERTDTSLPSSFSATLIFFDDAIADAVRISEDFEIDFLSSPVPAPATVALIGLALFGLRLRRKA